MKLKDQVCSLELAKRLKELGVKKESYFIWAKENLIPRLSILSLDKHELFEPYIFSAFTGAELGEMLPKALETGSDKVYYYTQIPTQDMRWFIEYRNSFNAIHANVHDIHEANARAKMLIYLIEQGFINEI